MKIFISWSGDVSRQVAIALHKWIPRVIQAAQPFVSATGIEKGQYWLPKILSELAESRFGIVCVTTENKEHPWLLFEAGALANQLGGARVSPLLLNLSQSDITYPLAALQSTDFSCADVTDLMLSISRAQEYPLAESIVRETVDRWWGDLQAEVEQALASSASRKATRHRPADDMLDEILRISRATARRVSELQSQPPTRDFGRTVMSESTASRPKHVGATIVSADGGRLEVNRYFYDQMEQGTLGIQGFDAEGKLVRTGLFDTREALVSFVRDSAPQVDADLVVSSLFKDQQDQQHDGGSLTPTEN